MRCENPKPSPAGVTWACGKCNSCKLQRKREWVGRLAAEWLTSARSCWATLTYTDPAPEELEPAHLKEFVKRVQEQFAPTTIRFFGCGEYGEKTGRPHFHVILFGVGPDKHHWIDAAWDWGFTQVRPVDAPVLSYVVGYTLKKMNAGPRADGKTPEFHKYSMRPGLGAAFCEEIGRAMRTDIGQAALLAKGDVPDTLMVSMREFPISPYRKRKIRQSVGMDPNVPPDIKTLNRMKQQAEKAFQLADYILNGRDYSKAAELNAAGRTLLANSKRQL